MAISPADSILHLTDFHFWEIVWNPLRLLNKRVLGNANILYRRRREFPMENAAPFAAEALRTGIKTALLSGDFASTATDREFAMAREFVQELAANGLEITVIPGNHDVYTFESVRKKRFERYLGAWLPEGGLPARIALPGGTPLILVPTVCPNAINSMGRISDTEAARVRELLADCAPPVLVCGHYPVLSRTHGYFSKPGRRLRNAEALHRALGKSGKEILYIAGHVHRSSYTQDARYPKLRHLTTGAFFRRAHETNSDGEFTEIHIGHTGFRVIRHRHAAGWTAETLEPAAEPASE